MAIRIERNEAGNCINFHGSSNPTYWNACLSGEVDSTDSNAVNVINDVITAQTGSTQYEFFRIPYTEFVDADGNGFADAQTAADYITTNANVIGLSGNGIDLIGQNVCFSLDATSTSVILDNGYSYGVNTIKAIESGGHIKIVSIDTNSNITHFYNLEVGNACINNAVVTGGLNDVINALNELFTVGAFQSVVITDPFSTMVADVSGVDTTMSVLGTGGIDPIGDDVFGASTSGSLNGYKSTETIDQAGEYFTFDIRNESQIGFGLVHSQDSYDAGYYSGSATYANPTTFGTQNSAHYGFQFSHWFHPTPNGSWTNYGANTSYSMGPAWYSSNTHFEARDEWLAGNPIKIKVGINENGFITISSLADDGVTWKLHARTSYAVPQGAEFHLGIKCGDTTGRVYTLPKVHELEPAAPTMYFRYVESPDGVFNYPVFATTEEAEYYDQNHNGTTGAGTYTTIVFPDDPTFTTWYIPTTGYTNNGTSAPSGQTFESNPIQWTEVTTLTDADLVPPAFQDTTITVDELSAVNYQLSPVDVGYTTSIGGIPAWSLVDGTTLQGTAPEVTGDNVSNPSDTTTVTVYRTNSYGTSSGTLTINITNLTAPIITPITGVTDEGGTSLIDSDTLDDGSVVSIDNIINVGNRFTFDKEWVDTYVLPKITAGTGAKTVFIGFPKPTANWSSVGIDDFLLAYQFYSDDTTRGQNNWRLRVLVDGTIQYNVGVGGQTNGLYDYALINDGTEIKLGSLVASQGLDISTYVYNFSGVDSTWKYTAGLTGVTSSSRDIVIATNGTDMDLDLQYFNEYLDAAAPTTLTNWNKALDFSGSSERAQQVSSNTNYMPIGMDGLSATVSAPSVSGNTSGNIYSRPWATAIVFNPDRNNSNQHIWNQGEGAGSSDDNIYVRLSSTGQVYFGWGRDGALNECYLGNVSQNSWYGLYIAHTGERLSGANANANNLADCFDIRWITLSSGTVHNNVSQASNWISTGGRMDRSVTGNLTIGGRGANRNFHGKVASFVTTTLRINQPMPTVAEIEMMVTDPKKWLQDYKDGNAYRVAYGQAEATFGLFNYLSNAAFATQVWLMGDGNLDNYSNMIRNQVYPQDQNYTKLNLISMVSNDIQNVNISGLS